MRDHPQCQKLEYNSKSCQMVSTARTSMGSPTLLGRRRHVVCWNNLCRACLARSFPTRRIGYRSIEEDIPNDGLPDRTRLASEWCDKSHFQLTRCDQGHTKLPDYHEIPGHVKRPWWSIIASVGQDGVNLVRELLKYNPAERPSARQVSTKV